MYQQRATYVVRPSQRVSHAILQTRSPRALSMHKSHYTASITCHSNNNRYYYYVLGISVGTYIPVRNPNVSLQPQRAGIYNYSLARYVLIYSSAVPNATIHVQRGVT